MALGNAHKVAADYVVGSGVSVFIKIVILHGGFPCVAIVGIEDHSGRVQRTVDAGNIVPTVQHTLSHFLGGGFVVLPGNLPDHQFADRPRRIVILRTDRPYARFLRYGIPLLVDVDGKTGLGCGGFLAMGGVGHHIGHALRAHHNLFCGKQHLDQLGDLLLDDLRSLDTHGGLEEQERQQHHRNSCCQRGTESTAGLLFRLTLGQIAQLLLGRVNVDTVDVGHGR